MKISYQRLNIFMASRGIDWTSLQKTTRISYRSISKLQNDEDVQTDTLVKICSAYQCRLSDIVDIVLDVKDKPLDDGETCNQNQETTVKRITHKKHVPNTEEQFLLSFPPAPKQCSPKANFQFIDLFAGIGGIRLGFESVGGQCVFSSEWDKDAANTYEANFGERPQGDITKIDPATIPDFDILLAGFPCQPFSIIGSKAGFEHETQGTLFFNIEEILKVKKPKAFMLENVRNLTVHDHGRTFKVITEHLTKAGYSIHYKVLNALDYGVPQKRERIIIVGFKNDIPFSFPEPLPKSERKQIKDILEPDEDISPKLFVSEKIRNSRLKRVKTDFPRPYISHENVAGNVTPHTYSCALRAGASANYLLINDERRPSEREMLRIQGFPDSFKIVGSYSQVRHQTGNSVAVPVMKAVAEQMIKSMLDSKEL